MLQLTTMLLRRRRSYPTASRTAFPKDRPKGRRSVRRPHPRESAHVDSPWLAQHDRYLHARTHRQYSTYTALAYTLMRRLGSRPGSVSTLSVGLSSIHFDCVQGGQEVAFEIGSEQDFMVALGAAVEGDDTLLEEGIRFVDRPHYQVTIRGEGFVGRRAGPRHARVRAASASASTSVRPEHVRE